jgi:hypothetical protein
MKLSWSSLRILALLFVILFGLIVPAQAQTIEEAAPTVEPAPDEGYSGIDLPWGVTVASGRTSVLHVPPPDDFSPLSAQAATITVRWISGAYVRQTRTYQCTTWPTAAQTAFRRAAAIWGSEIHSRVPILIDACWATNITEPNNLGAGGPTTFYVNQSGFPRSNTYYPVALANALTGRDINGSATAEIFTVYNSAWHTRGEFYYGTDARPPTTQIDFVTLVLHEIAHGLGFLGSMDADNTTRRARWGLGSPSYPVIYDRFAENLAGQQLINTSIFPNPSTALYNQLVSNNIFFDGPNARAANSNNRPKLDALPPEWTAGSSFSHVDLNSYRRGPNGLMVRLLDHGTAIHNIGNITRGIMRDLGWTFGRPAIRRVHLPVITQAWVPRPGYWRYANDMEMYVTPDSTGVRRFAIFVTVDDCGGRTYKIYRTVRDPIANNRFSFSGSFYASGRFNSATTASGTTGLRSFYISGCGYVTGGPWSWSATWRSSAQPTAASADELGVAVEVLESAPADGAYEAVSVE